MAFVRMATLSMNLRFSTRVDIYRYRYASWGKSELEHRPRIEFATSSLAAAILSKTNHYEGLTAYVRS